MMAARSFPAIFASVLLLTSCPHPARAAPKPAEQQEIDKCRDTTDRVARLACFDELFSTPANVKTLPSTPNDSMTAPGQVLPGRWQTLAEDQERIRPPGQITWLSRIRPWQASDYSADPAVQNAAMQADSFDMLLTMPELDLSAKPDAAGASDRAVLMVSCENNITSLMVLLPKPIAGLQANMSLGSESNDFSRLNWRDVEDGRIISAGRGLESIDTLRTLLGRNRLQLQVNYPDGARAFVFAVADLQTKLKPLRQACHW